MQSDDEYTDYSCSTSIERLARDVETELRNWHVVHGSDRHVSFVSTTASTTTAATSTNGTSTSETNTPSDQSVASAKKSHSSSSSSGRLHAIRSSRISWTVPLAANNGRVTIDLTLALWDYYAAAGPIPPSASNNQQSGTASSSTPASVASLHLDGGTKNTTTITTTTTTTSPNDEDSVPSDLPQSVRRSPLFCMANDPFENLSTLFGIGQHITLTPASAGTMTNQLAAETTVMTSLAESVLERHASGTDENTTFTNKNNNHKSNIAKLVVASSISSLMQMALNLAVANCECRIPVFGIWGHYPSNATSSNNNSNSNYSSSSSSSLSLIPEWMKLCQTMQLPRLPKRRVKRQPLFRFSSKKKSNFSSSSSHDGSAAAAERPLPPHFNQQHVPNLFVGSVLSSSSSTTTTMPSDILDMPVTTFRFCAFPNVGLHVVTASRLSTWAFLLWQQCRRDSSPEVKCETKSHPSDLNDRHEDSSSNIPDTDHRVVLCGARHVYTWLKPRKKPRSMLFANGTANELLREWRNLQFPSHPSPMSSSTLEEEESVESYREECRKFALSLLERACCGSSADDPLWGPPDDPIASVYAIATWDQRSPTSVRITPLISGTADNKTGSPQRRKKLQQRQQQQRQLQQSSLLTFPLRIRSKQFMTRQDWDEVETSMEQAMLDPIVNCSSFKVQAQYDMDTAVTTLAARLRCVLAALIRTATLPSETLLMHLTIETVMDVWDNDAGNFVADKLAMRAKAGQATRRLVTAMDWASVAEDMIEPWEAEAIVRNVLDGSLTLGFPSPPDEVFDPRREEGAASASSSDDDPWTALPRSAPAGRLLSILFAHMARVRASSSMAMIWSAFVKTIRKKWDARESLPNMNYIPGLDPVPEMSGAHKRWNYTIGLKADFSSFVHCSEPDPDDNYCLVGQKLQVFNLGVEGMITLGLQESERWEKLYQVEPEPAANYSVDETMSQHPDESMVDVATDAGIDGSPPKDKAFLVELHSSSTSGPHSEEESVENDFRRAGANDDVMFDIRDDRQVDFNMDGVQDWQEHSVGTMSKTLDYYDAFEGESVAGSVLGAQGISDVAANVAQLQDRKGARCPVHGVFLVASGDQLFAPYLLRPEPLTDDLILERRQMLSRSIAHEKGNLTLNNTSTVQHRLEVAQRLQKPKLLSDMRAFKAANPGAVFLDFVQWYGNPGNPLEDYSTEDQDAVQPGNAMGKNVAEKLDKASEAIHILTATRDFWSNTWDEATPCPAAEQKPLFDVCSTVEIALDYLETMHPASLLNQVMATNLATAYFVLKASAGDADKVSVVRQALINLRETTTSALQLLSRDVTQGTWSFYTHGKPPETSPGDLSPLFVTAEALAACETACNALADAETVISRCTSLLHKFPGQHDLVEALMLSGQSEVGSAKARAAVLRTVCRQQRPIDSASEVFSKPAMREYVFRNVDDLNPCQLSVRLGDESAMFEGGDPGGNLMLALTKTNRE